MRIPNVYIRWIPGLVVLVLTSLFTFTGRPAWASSGGCPVVFEDFEDGIIDSSLWEVGGSKRGAGGYGSGNWTWSHTESGGRLQLRVQGPTSGITYGAIARLQTVCDYNDGRDHIVQFTWGADVLDGDTHINSVVFQITDGTVVTNTDLGWFLTACDESLYIRDSGIRSLPPCDLPQLDMAPSRWSILIDARAQAAFLYDGPDLSGSMVGVQLLDPSESWHLRFVVMDGTSAGFPAGDTSLILYDYSSSVQWLDDFEDGVIDSEAWVTGGSRRGASGYDTGDWIWSILETGGALQLRVQGPTSGITYGAIAWARTACDYNDGRDHIVQFTWGADVLDGDTHINSVVFQITDGTVVTNTDLGWFLTPCDESLYIRDSGIRSLPPCDLPQLDMAPATWSIRIDASAQMATLYDGPNLSGSVVGQQILDPAEPWHLRMVAMDGTSAGFPAGDTALYLYDFESTASAPARGGLVAYYPFDGDLLDRSVYENHVAVNQGVEFASDRFGNPGRAIFLTGDDYLIVRSSDSLKIGGTAITVMAWVNPSQIGGDGNQNTILRKFSQTGNIGGYSFGIFSDGRLSLGARVVGETVGDFSAQGSPGLIPTDQWTHVAATYDGTVVRFYYNGLLDDTVVPVGPVGAIEVDDDDLAIGRLSESYNSEHFYGSLDEIRIYDRILSPSEIAGLVSQVELKRFAGLVISGPVGAVYEIQAVGDLTEPVTWATLVPELTIIDSPFVWVDEESGWLPARFYRALRLP